MAFGQREGAVRDADREPIVARDAADLLDDVLGDRDIGANRGGRGDQVVAIGCRRELEPAKNVQGLLGRDIDAEDSGDVGEAHSHVHAPTWPRVSVHHAGDLGTRVLAKQTARARERDGDQIGRELP